MTPDHPSTGLTQARPDLAPGLSLVRGAEGNGWSHGLPAFKQHWFWRTGDLQTLRNSFKSTPAMGHAMDHQRLLVPLAEDAGALSVMLDSPGQIRDPRLIVLIHGLGGCEDSFYLRTAADHFLGHGFRVARLNLRGAGPSAATAAGPYHAGLTQDLDATLQFLKARQFATEFLLMGFSLGGQLALKYLGNHAARDVGAAVSVSAPIDLAETERRIRLRRNAIYQRYILRNLARDAAASPRLSDQQKEQVALAKSVRDFDAAAVVPTFGFNSVDDYYTKAAAKDDLICIDTSTLIIHAVDDPWIPVRAYREVSLSRQCLVVLTEGGGHVGFHQNNGCPPWHLAAAERFFASLLADE